MKLPAIHVLIASFALCSTAACSWKPYGDVRVVRRAKAGGELAILGDREVAMQKANSTMATTCGGPDRYEIVEEGETVVGEESVSESSERREKDFFGPKKRKQENTSTVQTTEWRVKYECKEGEPAAEKAAPADDAAPSDDAPEASEGKTEGRRVHEVIIRF
ncbi:hypothetical protein WME75_07590 [Sorangium sp. So ce1014]|uniref:hypothetical protein n=1 Tax=Sorangium sp. So ce1014 TaxID=3133326 RepID=UPI003F6022D1